MQFHIQRKAEQTFQTLGPEDQKEMYLADSFTIAKGVTQPRGTYNKLYKCI